MALAQQGFVQLLTKPTGEQLLIHMLTEERKTLETTGWTLHFDGEGNGYLHKGGEAKWVEELLPEKMLGEAATEGLEPSKYIYEAGTEKTVWLKDFCQQHQVMSAQVATGCEKPLVATVLQFAAARNGCYYFWQCTSIQEPECCLSF